MRVTNGNVSFATIVLLKHSLCIYKLVNNHYYHSESEELGHYYFGKEGSFVQFYIYHQ